MPKHDIDYSNTIIYKIFCKDSTITDLYIGHTTNFVQRKHAHKQFCNNNKIDKCKLYQFIQDNGGWSNWKMEIVAFFNCENHFEARQKEQEYFISLNATLNSIEPCKTNTEIKPKVQIQPKLQIQPKTQIQPDIQSNYKYGCIHCNITTNNKKDYNRHLFTNKHKRETCIEINKPVSIPIYKCKCEIVFNSRTTLWRHKKHCVQEPNTIIENVSTIDDEFDQATIIQEEELTSIVTDDNNITAIETLFINKFLNPFLTKITETMVESNKVFKQKIKQQSKLIDCQNALIQNIFI